MCFGPHYIFVCQVALDSFSPVCIFVDVQKLSRVRIFLQCCPTLPLHVPVGTTSALFSGTVGSRCFWLRRLLNQTQIKSPPWGFPLHVCIFIYRGWFQQIEYNSQAHHYNIFQCRCHTLQLLNAFSQWIPMDLFGATYTDGDVCFQGHSI